MLDLSSCRYNFTQATQYKLTNQHVNVMFWYFYLLFTLLSPAFLSHDGQSQKQQSLLRLSCGKGENYGQQELIVASLEYPVLPNPIGHCKWGCQRAVSIGWKSKWSLFWVSVDWLVYLEEERLSCQWNSLASVNTQKKTCWTNIQTLISQGFNLFWISILKHYFLLKLLLINQNCWYVLIIRKTLDLIVHMHLKHMQYGNNFVLSTYSAISCHKNHAKMNLSQNWPLLYQVLCWKTA